MADCYLLYYHLLSHVYIESGTKIGTKNKWWQYEVYR